MSETDRYLHGLVNNLENLSGTISLTNGYNGSVQPSEEITGTLSSTLDINGKLSNATLRGYSAYDVAVAHGFEGTEEEWLASLNGNGIESTVLNPDYTLTVYFTDGTQYTTPPIRGETGNGIESVRLNNDYTLTINFTDGTSYTTPSIRGEKGEQGTQGVQGYSAYEIAVQHGFNGTEEEWLMSLGAKPASDVQSGIMKLYNTTGENTDGTMTQRSITHAIADSAAESISAEEIIGITT